MKNKKLIAMLLILVLVLTGCGTGSGDDLATGFDGFSWTSFNYMFSWTIVKISQLLGNNLVYGVIVSTILVRGLMLPVYRKQMKSNEAMQKIQPEMQKIQKKYEGKTSQEARQKMAMEQQALYKDHGVSPLSGCLPTLLQMPILFVYYGAVRNLFYFTAEGSDGAQHTAEYFMTGSDMAKDFLFFGDVSAPNMIILAVLAGLTSLLSIWVSTIGQDKNNPSYGMMKTMFFMMPIMMGFVAYSSPGAMAIYLIVSSLFTFLQTLYFKRDKIRDVREKNKLEKNNKK